MNMDNTAPTILHVEDDPVLVKLVRTIFQRFGFHGQMISAERVDETIELLDARARDRQPVDLILVDMQLPDGTGLDVIREVKSDPAWRMVPVVVLSNESSDWMVNGAYALGANCFMPKIPGPDNSLDILRTLYTCWLEASLSPRRQRRDRLRDALARGVNIRARTSEFYCKLACSFAEEPDEMGFWLDRSLNEGNMSNLLAFVRNMVSESDMPEEMIDRLADMQLRFRKALIVAEARLRRKPAPVSEEACRWVLDFLVALDEELLADVLGCLFPKGPVATTALKARAAAQIKELSAHILDRTEGAEIRARASSLLKWCERFA
ncbi:MAG TPA: response regulator [Geobacteraceae bacterium]|nr:response regulator [Geobacteraceae bacterium]